MNEITDATALTAPNSKVRGADVVRGVGQRVHPGGEDVDIGLDSLVGIVDRVVDEPGPVVRVAVEPVAGESIGQPLAPCQHEPLRHEEIQHDAHT